MIHDPDASALGRCPGLPDDAFLHDGLITKRVVRAMALAQLRPRPGETLWDLGTGAGSVAVEWCRTDPTCRAVGVERKADRAANARANAEHLTLPGQFEIVDADLTRGLPELPDPDAVFIGGGASDDVVAAVLALLPEGGRLVVHGVTLETEVAVAGWHEQHGGELSRVAVETSDSIGRLRGWKPARTVTCWVYSR